MNNLQSISIDNSVLLNKIQEQQSNIQELKIKLAYETELRLRADKQVMELEAKLKDLLSKKRKTKEEVEAERKLVLEYRNEGMSATKIAKRMNLSINAVSNHLNLIEGYNPNKINGVKKAGKMEAIRSYDDLKLIQNYFLEKNQIRNYMMWTIGVAFGIRISDLLKLKIKHLLNSDLTFKERVLIYEQKTQKLQDLLISEAVVDAVTMYFDSINWEFDLEDKLISKKGSGESFDEKQGWYIINKASKDLNLPLRMGSHSMRKSFLTIGACVYSEKARMDAGALELLQGLANHSDARCTLRYLDSHRRTYDNVRHSVSDFLLGKTDINELEIENSYTIKDVYGKLENLSDLISEFLTENKGENADEV